MHGISDKTQILQKNLVHNESKVGWVLNCKICCKIIHIRTVHFNKRSIENEFPQVGETSKTLC